MTTPRHRLSFSMGLLLTAPLAAQVQSDDILVSYSGAPGIEVFRPDGTLVMQAGALTGSSYAGVVLNAEGLVVTTRMSPQNGLDFVDAAGTEVRSFVTPQVTGIPVDVSMFSDGVLAVTDQSGDIDLLDALGLYVGTISAPGLQFPLGTWIDANDELWVAEIGASSSFGTIWHFDRSGALLGSIPTNFSPGDVVVAPDGTLWVASRLEGIAYHLAPTGAVLGSFRAVTTGTTSNTFYGLALAADGTLFATAQSESQIYHYDSAGTLLGTFPINGTKPFFIRVAGNGGGGLSGTPDQISVSGGGSQVLSVTMNAALAGKSYQVLGSVTGTLPGVTYGGVNVPLNLDSYLLFTLLNPNTPPLSGSAGVLNSLGQATAVFTLPPASDPSLVGFAVNHAALALDLVGGAIAILEATDAAGLLLVP